MEKTGNNPINPINPIFFATPYARARASTRACFGAGGCFDAAYCCCRRLAEFLLTFKIDWIDWIDWIYPCKLGLFTNPISLYFSLKIGLIGLADENEPERDPRH